MKISHKLFFLFAILVLWPSVKATAANYPPSIFDWPVFTVQDGKMRLAEGAIPFEPLNPLFSDYALKFRTIKIPDGTQIRLGNEGHLVFPVGTVISKTFFYTRESINFQNGRATQALSYVTDNYTQPLMAKHLVETRILSKTEDGWIGLPYVWNEAQTDATLKIIGARRDYELKTGGELRAFRYQVPNLNQCKSCHISHDGFEKTVLPIGPTVQNLDHEINFAGEGWYGQLQFWQDKGILEAGFESHLSRALVKWDDLSQSFEKRARAYLDINCAHCHNPKGPADTSSLHLGFNVTDSLKLGVCKSPVATGNGGIKDGFVITPADPNKSILYSRLRSLNPAEMMPEIGRHLVHNEGLDLIEQWILEMNGACR
ncbi:MAG: SO2930 family diheme c-type cytochrome [Oligoflexus sp.]